MLSQSDPHSNKAHGSRNKPSAQNRAGYGSSVTGRRDPFNPNKLRGSEGYREARRGVVGGSSNLAQAAGDAGRNIFNMANPAYGKALGFYNDLLKGGASMQQALSPAVTKIREVGSSMTGGGNYGRNPAALIAKEENKRRMMSDINTMYAGAPGAAASALASLGLEGQQSAANFANIAGNQWNQLGYLTNQAVRDERAAEDTNQSFFQNIGRWGARIAAAYFTGGGSEVGRQIIGLTGGDPGSREPRQTLQQRPIPSYQMFGLNPNVRGYPSLTRRDRRTDGWDGRQGW